MSKNKMIKLILIFTTLVFFWFLGAWITVNIHEDNFIKQKNKQLIVDVKNNVDDFDKDKLLSVYDFYTTTEGRTPMSLFIKKISILGRNISGEYYVEYRTIFNIKIYETFFSKKLDQISEDGPIFKDKFE